MSVLWVCVIISSSYTIKMSMLYCVFIFLGYIDNCLSFVNVFFLCLHVRLIYALNYYLLTYLQRREDKACQFKVDTSLNRKLMPLVQYWRDMFMSSGSSEKPSGGILDGLNFPNEAVGHTVQE